MNRAPLTPATMEPALQTFLADLALLTCVDTFAFETWSYHNRFALLLHFSRERLPEDYFRGWAMVKFVKREIERA